MKSEDEMKFEGQLAMAGFMDDLYDAAVLGETALPPRSPMAVERECGAHNYEPLPVVIVRGQGVHLWDEHGRRYTDMMSAYSAVSFGHAHPRILDALRTQAGKLAVTSRAYYNDQLPFFLQRLCEITGQDLALPTNTVRKRSRPRSKRPANGAAR
jgi:4-aminobutyrate aminotransferase-like enzyme